MTNDEIPNDEGMIPRLRDTNDPWVRDEDAGGWEESC